MNIFDGYDKYVRPETENARLMRQEQQAKSEQSLFELEEEKMNKVEKSYQDLMEQIKSLEAEVSSLKLQKGDCEHVGSDCEST